MLLTANYSYIITNTLRCAWSSVGRESRLNKQTRGKTTKQRHVIKGELLITQLVLWGDVVCHRFFLRWSRRWENDFTLEMERWQIGEIEIRSLAPGLAPRNFSIAHERFHSEIGKNSNVKKFNLDILLFCCTWRGKWKSILIDGKFSTFLLSWKLARQVINNCLKVKAISNCSRSSNFF